MLSEFIIGQAGHPACCFMLFFCIKTLLMKDLKLGLTGFKLLFQGGLFLCKGVFPGQILFRRQLPFTIVFIDCRLDLLGQVFAVIVVDEVFEGNIHTDSLLSRYVFKTWLLYSARSFLFASFLL